VAKLRGISAGGNTNSFAKGWLARRCRRMLNMPLWLAKLQEKETD